MRKVYKKDVIKLYNKLKREMEAAQGKERTILEKVLKRFMLDDRHARVCKIYFQRTKIHHPHISAQRENPKYAKAVEAYDAYMAELQKIEDEQEREYLEMEEVNKRLEKECTAIGMHDTGGWFVTGTSVVHPSLIYDSNKK